MIIYIYTCICSSVSTLPVWGVGLLIGPNYSPHAKTLILATLLGPKNPQESWVPSKTNDKSALLLFKKNVVPAASWDVPRWLKQKKNYSCGIDRYITHTNADTYRDLWFPYGIGQSCAPQTIYTPRNERRSCEAGIDLWCRWTSTETLGISPTRCC